MQLSELRTRLRELKDEGFTPSLRKGPTGIGHTLEDRLGLSENNLPIPDIGGRVEIKATRNDRNNLITLFTFNRAVWMHSKKNLIEQWGYNDKSGRIALYSTVSAVETNSQGFQLSVSEEDDYLIMSHMPGNIALARWDMYYIVGKFASKFEKLLFVHADAMMIAGKEHFHYNKAEILSEPSARTFKNGFVNGLVKVDVRMHLKPNGAVRNHGTGFRIAEQDLPRLFGRTTPLL